MASTKKKLPRTKQCAKCPWRRGTKPQEIPGGYSEEKHCNLDRTIARDLKFGQTNLHVMACHESMPDNEQHCIGWLMNQLGPGNNIELRIRMMGYDLSQVKLDGPQHTTFEETLP